MKTNKKQLTINNFFIKLYKKLRIKLINFLFLYKTTDKKLI